MIALTVYHEHPAYRRLKQETLRLARGVLRGEGRTTADITVVFTGDRRMRTLNTTWLNHRYTTDVLSFPLSGPRETLSGEIYINVDQARRQAPDFHATPADELRRLVVHGLLHLLGYDDASAAQRRAMTAREDRYLR